MPTSLELVYGGAIQSFHVDNNANIAGNTTLYVVPNEALQLRTVTANNVVTGFTNDGAWNQFVNLKNLTYKVTTNIRKSGVSYGVEVSFLVPGIGTEKTAILTNLLDTKLTVMLRDANGVFHLFGASHPLEVVTLDFVNTDTNQYEIKLTTTQKAKPVQVSSTAVANLVLNPFTNSLEVITPGTGTGTPTATNTKFTYTLPMPL